jgi:hypothetical protein
MMNLGVLNGLYIVLEVLLIEFVKFAITGFFLFFYIDIFNDYNN